MTSSPGIERLLDELTLEEKTSLLSGRDFWHTNAVDRLDVPSIMVADGPHGLRKQVSGSGDHVGLQGSVPATCFPTAAALASSWDPELVREVGEAIGDEARSQALAVVLGPGINIKRSPLCGRNFEYLSEDPTLTGLLGTAMVRGIQSRGVGTSLKHFALNNQETDRFRASSDVDAVTMREIYLDGFERIVRNAAPWTVMCSYNRINGEWASQDRWLLTELLRDEWGFDGLVVSDWGAVADPVASVRAGLDLEMPGTGGVSARILAEAVRAGDLGEDVLDEAVRRLLVLIERAAPGLREGGGEIPVDEHDRLARRAAAESAVLLTNDGVLPLRPEAGERIAVIGEFARTPRFQGAGSSKVNPLRVTNALDALHELVPDGVTIDFAAGFGVDDTTADDARLATEALEIAEGADRVVLFLGLPASHESEGFDRTHMDLPRVQLDLLDRLADLPAELVVVLSHGAVVTMAPWMDRADAILDLWLGGQASGGAAADVLLGRVDPSGRLAETVPMRLQDTPSYLNFGSADGHVAYAEGRFVGHRHHDALDQPVAFPFGHGLSYTTFRLTDVTVDAIADGTPGDEDWRGPVQARVSVTVTNTGDRSGAEVVQVYVGRPGPSEPRPPRELRAFRKVRLEPGEHRTVDLELTARDFSTWSSEDDGWRHEAGPASVWVGTSSRDLPHRADIIVPGDVPTATLDLGSTIGEWHEHPVGHDVLIAKLRSTVAGDFTFLLDDPEGFLMLQSIPLDRLHRMTGGIVDRADAFLSELPDGVART